MLLIYKKEPANTEQGLLTKSKENIQMKKSEQMQPGLEMKRQKQ